MQKTLADIEAGALVLLSQGGSAFWGDAANNSALDLLINDAYQELVTELDQLPNAWIAVPEGQATGVQNITTAAGQREYAATGSAAARSLIDIRRPSDGIGLSPYVSIPQVSYNNRDQPGRAGCYVFRSLTDGKFYVGLLQLPPLYTTINVLYRPAVAPLAAAGDVPTQVPSNFHEIITYRTAVLAFLGEGRLKEAQGVEALADRRFAQLIRACGDMVRQTSRRF